MSLHQINLLPKDDNTNGWAAGLPPRTPRPALQGDIRADWVVVGAGYAGLAAARRLAENRPSEKVVLIEAGAAADGAAGRNSGFAIDLPHAVGITGDENAKARAYMRLARAAIRQLKDLIDHHGIDCGWNEKGKYQAAVTEAGVDTFLKPFAQALDRLDEPYEWIDFDALRARVGMTHFKRAIFTPGGALLNPVALVRGLADTLPENVELYEHTPALSVEYANGVRLTTPEGSIFAPKMVLGVNSFAADFDVLRNKIIPVVAHATLSRPLTAEEQAAYGVEEAWGLTPGNSLVGITMRYTHDKRLLIRELIDYNPKRRVSDGDRRALTIRHKKLFDQRYPMLKHVEMAHTWSGHLALTRNGAPGFGEVRPGVFMACAQNAIGITKGTISGHLVADMACGVDNPLIADMAGLGVPTDLPTQPFLGWGVRTRLSWERFRWRSEA
ncbi:MAG: FAD-dependent oxidoreductase [Pseudomonadota bacterium]